MDMTKKSQLVTAVRYETDTCLPATVIDQLTRMKFLANANLLHAVSPEIYKAITGSSGIAG